MQSSNGNHLLVLQFNSHHSEGVVGSVVVDVDAAEALLPRLDGHPFLTGVVIDHHRGPRLADTLFTGGEERTQEAQVNIVTGSFNGNIKEYVQKNTFIYPVYCQRRP